MNVNQIRYFVSVAQEGSLSQAARLHGVTAQAISKSINELERDVKEPLFFREHSGMRLTTFGQGFFERAKDALTAFDNLQAMVSEGNLASAQIQFEEPDKLRVLVCAPSFSMKDSAMRQATSFAEAFLGTPTELSLGSGQEGMKGLDKGGLRRHHHHRNAVGPRFRMPDRRARPCLRVPVEKPPPGKKGKRDHG